MGDPFRRAVPAVGFVVRIAPRTHAQAPDIDAWMHRHFSGKPGVWQNVAVDEILYAAIGLDSLCRSRFIGEVKGTATLPDKSMPVQFVTPISSQGKAVRWTP